MIELEKECSQMKPFITPRITLHGKKLFEFQVEGVRTDNLHSVLINQKVSAYWMPDSHNFKAAWKFILIFDNDTGIEFSSACTAVVDWEEIGSLNMLFVSAAAGHLGMTESEKRQDIRPSLPVRGMEKIVYEGNDFITECGVAILGHDGSEIIITTGISPGSVSILTAFSKNTFEPEFPLSSCKRKACWT
ncbi:hypothetical protein [Massilia sp. CCM 8734]|uniref:hypothetical protein n=1 Tax=Massilia sp. CCM 8734 TaxID=2609283 RepID=UPI00141DAEF0|nr:hypothetical protein [Massilia sp. CCM 8734]NHZ99751.1 hypothetical protein [Massilia sp. CCM 8734]